MIDNIFEKSNEIVIKINEKIVGGVTKASCEQQRKIEKYYQFLSDEPVNCNACDSYVLTINLDCNDDFIINENCNNTIKICSSKKEVEYINCCLLSEEFLLLPNKNTSKKLVFLAEKRREYCKSF